MIPLCAIKTVLGDDTQGNNDIVRIRIANFDCKGRR